MSTADENPLFQLDAMLGPHGKKIQSAVAQRCRHKLELNPQDSDSWLGLGHSLRALAQYQEAAAAYQKAADFGADPMVMHYLCGLLQQQYKPAKKPVDKRFLAVPFMLKDGFLNSFEQQKVWDLYSQHADGYRQSRAGKNISADLKPRASMVINRSQLGYSELNFVEQKLQPILLEAYSYFSMAYPKSEKLTMQMTSHADGEYYRIHRDIGESLPSRLLTFVYYFYQQPKHFEGGELQLFDSHESKDSHSNHYTSIEPLHNRLVLFPSKYFHQVSTVTMASNNRLNSRHSINGWHLDQDLNPHR